MTYWSDDTGAVGSNQAGLALRLEHVGDADHVVLRDTLGNTDNERNLSLDRLLNACCGDRRRHEDSRSSSTSLLDGVRHVLEDRLSQVLLPSLLWVGTSDDLCAILNCLLCVESTLLAGETLEDDLCIAVDPEVRVGGQVRGIGGSIGSSLQRRPEGGARGLSEALHGAAGWVEQTMG